MNASGRTIRDPPVAVQGQADDKALLEVELMCKGELKRDVCSEMQKIDGKVLSMLHSGGCVPACRWIVIRCSGQRIRCIEVVRSMLRHGECEDVGEEDEVIVVTRRPNEIHVFVLVLTFSEDGLIVDMHSTVCETQ